LEHVLRRDVRSEVDEAERRAAEDELGDDEGDEDTPMDA
jgi:hypothetical protein